MSDKRHGDPQHGGLTTGEKSAITRAVHEGRGMHFTEKHPEHAEAAEQYRREVEAKEGGQPQGAQGGGVHHRELGRGEKAAVARAVHGGKEVSELPFVHGHPAKLEKALEYAEKVKRGEHKEEEGEEGE